MSRAPSFQLRRIPTTEVKDRKNDPHAKWDDAKERLAGGGSPDIAISPSFKLEKGATVFTMGSCFARNIENRLEAAGYDVPMTAFSVPDAEYPGLERGIMNKYTPTAIYEEISWAESIQWSNSDVTLGNCQTMRYLLDDPMDVDDPRVIDLNLGGYVPVTQSRFLERRQQIYDLVTHIYKSDVIVLTLGLIEAWVDTTNGEYIQQAPIGKHFKGTEDRFAFVRLSMAKCLATMHDVIDLIRRHNKRARILLTVSPVPLGRTFAGEDVILANMQSKAVLRAVAGEVCAAHEQVDYFPSYEMVMLDGGADVWSDDRRHVSDKTVDGVVERLLDAYAG